MSCQDVSIINLWLIEFSYFVLFAGLYTFKRSAARKMEGVKLICCLLKSSPYMMLLKDDVYPRHMGDTYSRSQLIISNVKAVI